MLKRGEKGIIFEKLYFQVIEEFKWIWGIDDREFDDYVRKIETMLKTLYDNEEGDTKKVKIKKEVFLVKRVLYSG